MSQCYNCEGNQLVEDEATGQLICVDCGTATGVFSGSSQIQVILNAIFCNLVYNVFACMYLCMFLCVYKDDFSNNYDVFVLLDY